MIVIFRDSSNVIEVDEINKRNAKKIPSAPGSQTILGLVRKNVWIKDVLGLADVYTGTTGRNCE